MAKKDFSGIDTLIQETTTKRGRPKVHTHAPKTKAAVGLPDGYTRSTFVMSEDELLRLRALSHWTRVNISAIVQKAVSNFLSEYEKKNGVIQPLPDKQEL
jgi:hypothetical protein